jgi:hypothetical protein
MRRAAAGIRPRQRGQFTQTDTAHPATAPGVCRVRAPASLCAAPAPTRSATAMVEFDTRNVQQCRQSACTGSWSCNDSIRKNGVTPCQLTREHVRYALARPSAATQTRLNRRTIRADGGSKLSTQVPPPQPPATSSASASVSIAGASPTGHACRRECQFSDTGAIHPQIMRE